MDSIQEALRELLQRSAAKKTDQEHNFKPVKVKKRQRIKEAVELKRPKDKMLTDLWDQVYCSLVDVGSNEAYAICGGKGKYSYSQVPSKIAKTKYDDNVIIVRYDKGVEEKPESKFFAEAERIAEKFGLKTTKLERSNHIDFNMFIPQDEPVYFDLVPEQFREKIALENDEDFNDLPVSPHYEGTLKITPKTNKNTNEEMHEKEKTILKDGKQLKVLKEVTFNRMLVVLLEGWNTVTPWVIGVDFDYKDKTWSWGHYYSTLKAALQDWKKYEPTVEKLAEDFAPELPFSILPKDEILDFVTAIPKATAQRGPASLTFTIGIATEVDVASKFKENGRGNIDKETGEVYPRVKIVKCSEISGLYLERYQSSKKTKAHNKQLQAYKDNPEYEQEIAPKREITPWLNPTEYRSVFTSKSNGELVLAPLLSKNSRGKTKYFMSIDNEPFIEATKEQILPYLTPAKQLEVSGEKDYSPKIGPDNQPIISAAKMLTLYFNKIYRIGNKGQSIM